MSKSLVAKNQANVDQTNNNISKNNVFHDLKKRNSILLTLFNLKNPEILNLGAQAPPPSKDYCQLLLTFDKVVFRSWRITLRGDSDTKYPTEIKDTYEDFIHDDVIQRDISRIFGKATLTYVRNIIEYGKVDYLTRLKENVLLKIISFLDLEDISRLSQVNAQFRELCRSDRVWFELYKKYYSREISRDLYKLAERDGWRKLFFTNKIKLQLELRRQAKSDHNGDDDNSIYHTPRRHHSTLTADTPTKSRIGKSASRRNELSKTIDPSNNKLRFTTFLTED